MATISTPSTALPTDWSVANLQQHLGGIPLERIRLYPPPGMATEKDLLALLDDREKRICELIDGVLVEKTMGYYESQIASLIGHFIHSFLDQHNLGIVLGEAGTLRILPEQVRIADVAFIRWERFPNGKLPHEPVPALAPDLAIEVLSKGNTEPEMHRKLRDYFAAGVRLVWYIDPESQTATAYTAADQSTAIGRDGVLDGGDVLPGFTLSLTELFAKAGPRE
ncbi:MAG: Uma2 family endonuclease [Planctomycetes bacterium]|nr:Uma2 family endonuclease [Planctomycetota bacterium]